MTVLSDTRPGAAEAAAEEAVLSQGSPLAVVSSREEAQQRAARIRTGLTGIGEAALEAWNRRDHKVLGYADWKAYCEGEFNRREQIMQARQAIVLLLRGEGLSRAVIADRVGYSKNTVNNDVRNPIIPPEKPLPERIKGRNGKFYPARQPRKVRSDDTVPEPSPRKVREDRPSPDEQKVREDRPVPVPPPSLKQQMSGIADAVSENEYRAMLRAPKGSVNVPMLNRASAVVEAIGDLTGIDPELAATMMPATRCREFAGTAEFAYWWIRFAEACEARRAAETPDLKPLTRLSAVKWSDEGRDAAERKLPPGAKAALDWLRGHGKATAAQVGLGIGGDSGSALTTLVSAGYVTAVGFDGRLRVYEAVQAPQ